jgi:hypothetical protein
VEPPIGLHYGRGVGRGWATLTDAKKHDHRAAAQSPAQASSRQACVCVTLCSYICVQLYKRGTPPTIVPLSQQRPEREGESHADDLSIPGQGCRVAAGTQCPRPVRWLRESLRGLVWRAGHRRRGCADPAAPQPAQSARWPTCHHLHLPLRPGGWPCPCASTYQQLLRGGLPPSAASVRAWRVSCRPRPRQTRGRRRLACRQQPG